MLKSELKTIQDKFFDRVMNDDNTGMLVKNFIRDSDANVQREKRSKFVKAFLIMSLGGNPDDHANDKNADLRCMSNAELVAIYREMNGRIPSEAQREENYEHMVANLLAALTKDLDIQAPLVKESIDRALAAKDKIVGLMPIV